MSLFGDCEDCGRAAQLRYKPDVPISAQSRPSICYDCKIRREELLEESSPIGSSEFRGFEESGY